MGLLGMARRAGAARGAYMAEMENYHRQRQGMLDQRQAMLDQSLLDFRRQQMGIAAAGERRAQATFDSNQGWLAKVRANTEQGWKNAEAARLLKTKNDAEDRALKLKRDAEDREQKKREWEYKNYGMEDQDYLNWLKIEEAENQLNSYDNLTPEQQALVNYPGLVRMAAITAKASGGSGKKNSGKAKPPISDTILKANAEAVTPERMKIAFGRKFYDTDAKIQKRTGMSRDELMKTLADQYRAHLLSARENAMDEDDFIRQQAEQYGFWDKHDLGRLVKAMSDNKTRHGFGFFGFGRRSAEEEYARRNPAFYKHQKELIEAIDNGVNLLFKDKDSKVVPSYTEAEQMTKNKVDLADQIKMDRDMVRNFDKYRNKKGLSNGDAVLYAVLHDYAAKNNLDVQAMIDNFRNHPGESKTFMQYVRKNGLNAALSQFNQPAFRRRQEIWK